MQHDSIRRKIAPESSMLLGTPPAIPHYPGIMFRYRFITPHRRGKWYPDLQTAQRFAAQIGAGFLGSRSGKFFAYLGTQLEVKPARAT